MGVGIILCTYSASFNELALAVCHTSRYCTCCTGWREEIVTTHFKKLLRVYVIPVVGLVVVTVFTAKFHGPSLSSANLWLSQPIAGSLHFSGDSKP